MTQRSQGTCLVLVSMHIPKLDNRMSQRYFRIIGCFKDTNTFVAEATWQLIYFANPKCVNVIFEEGLKSIYMYWHFETNCDSLCYVYPM